MVRFLREDRNVEQTVSKDGTVIGFWQRGAGPPLLLVHGTTADHSRWASVSPALEQQFTVIAMDRRGRGGSGDASDYDIMREAEDVAAVVEAMGVPLAVLGHSYGAICALEAARLTDKVRRLVLYEPPIPTGLAHYPPGVPDQIQALVDRDEFEAALELFFRDVVGMPKHELAAYRQLPVWNVRIQLAPTIPRELLIDRGYRFEAENFASLTIPTLLLLGGDSPPLFQRAVAAVDAALADSRVVVLPGQQHIVMDTNPELFVTEVQQFLLA